MELNLKFSRMHRLGIPQDRIDDLSKASLLLRQWHSVDEDLQHEF